MADIPLHLRLIRGALRRMNIYLSRRSESQRREPVHEGPAIDRPEDEAALRKLRLPDTAAQVYFDRHFPRLVRTLSLVPHAHGPQRVLELGCYMQLTPALKFYCGYGEVYGAEMGPLGARHHKTAHYGDKLFELDVDLFDAERDVFPYPDGYFNLVLACEILEHMLYDPMHLLLESRRVLAEGGRILITTPNIASLVSVARVLHGYDNPQIHSKYKLPGSTPGLEVQHMREYTFAELGEAVRSAGFEIEQMFTERIADYDHHEALQFFLEQHGYNPANRGEQTYCIAVKRAALPVTRYPEFLYE